MATREQVVALAKSQVGTRESPYGSNHQKYGVWYGMDYVQWCAIFVSWVMHHVGVDLRITTDKGYSYCPSAVSWAQARGLWRSSRRSKPGDIIMFNFYGGGEAEHTGIVYKNNPLSSYIWTIEGNTGTSSQSNGGEVMIRQRPRSQVLGTINMGVYLKADPKKIEWADRPKWAGDNKPTGHYVLKRGVEGHGVRHMQSLLLHHGRNVVVDGDFGPGTEHHLKEFQRYHEMKVDGICGKRTWEMLHHEATKRERRRWLRIRASR